VTQDSLSLEGPAFPILTRVLATLLIAALAAKGAQVSDRVNWQAVDSPMILFGVMAAIAVLGGYWAILTSRTSINATYIRQTGLWNKEVKIAQIASLKLIHFERVAWLIAPRLIVRGGSLGAQTFYCADPRVLHAFSVLAHGSVEPKS
jgi:hypothetical protein